MHDTRAAMEQALQALEYMHSEKFDYMVRNKLGDPSKETATKLAVTAIASLRAALAARPTLERDTVIRLAREAVNSGDGSELTGDAIERFAQLVFLEAARPLLVREPALPPKIAAIIERLHTQDNRITSHPLFAVQQRRRIYGLDSDYRDGVVFVDDEGIEFAERDSVENGCREVGYRDTWEFVTGCMTEQGCKDYIAVNGHNLREPRIYAYGSYRNAEFIALREWLMSLAAAPSPDTPAGGN